MPFLLFGLNMNGARESMNFTYLT